MAYIKDHAKEMAANGFSPTTSFNLGSMLWMLNGKIDKTAYFAAKITEANENKKNYPDLIELYRKGGFVFYKREPK